MSPSRLVLVVDDNALNCRLMALVLQSRGLEVETVASAEDALVFLRTRTPAVILLDLQLPGMSGFDLLHLLRQDPATARIPVLAVTACAMKGDEQRALAAGFDAYVTKPIDTRAMPTLVARWLGE